MNYGIGFDALSQFAFVNNPTALMVVAGALLLLFGGKNIPELMKGLGQGMREFKKGMEQDVDETKPSLSDRDAEIEAEVRRRLELERRNALTANNHAERRLNS